MDKKVDDFGVLKIFGAKGPYFLILSKRNFKMCRTLDELQEYAKENTGLVFSFTVYSDYPLANSYPIVVPVSTKPLDWNFERTKDAYRENRRCPYCGR